MKRIHRVTAWLLVLVFCLTALPVSAAAATVTVGNVTAKAGDTVVVPVSISRLENIASIGLHVWYDPAVLKCLDAKMSDVIGGMDMANANTKPVNHPNEVFLTAISLKPVVLDGVVMTVTFEVLSGAPAGVAAVKVQNEGLSVSTTELKELEIDVVNGGVTVEGDAASEPGSSAVSTTTTVNKTTTGANTTTAGTDDDGKSAVQTTSQSATQTSQTEDSADEQPMTSTTFELPEETVVDIVGNIVTDAKGEPTKVKAIGVIVGSATAGPNETVTVKVSLSAVSDLTALGLAVHYDKNALSFEGGECIGFVKDSASMRAVVENEAGIVDISAMASNGMSGSGDIAELRFKVKHTAKNGEYRLAVKGDPLLQTSELQLPVKAVAGQIRVEGAVQGGQNGLYAALGIVAVAAFAALTVWWCLRRKKNAPAKEVPVAPAVVDVSGEDEE